MKKEFFVLTLAVIIFWLFGTLPVSAQTAGDYEYAALDGTAAIIGYQGEGGNVTIPSVLDGIPVTKISSFAFADCDNITALTIPDGITSIGECAFLGCTSLTSLTVGVKVADIAAEAFRDCTALTNIVWNAVHVRGFAAADRVFANAGTAKTGIRVVFGDSVETIPHHLFFAEGAYPKISAVVIGKQVKAIGNYAFPYCQCTSLVIPDQVETIGEYAFINGSFSSLTLGRGLREIGKSTFFGCKKLSAVTLPGNVATVNNSAFRFCSTLSQITLKEGIEEIGIVAFADCPALTVVTIPKSIKVIDEEAFGYDFSGAAPGRVDLTIKGYTYTAAQRYAGENGFPFVSLGGAFSDVPADAWYGSSVDDLVARGILSGYAKADGTYCFQPAKNISRAEFAVILARSAGADLTSYAGVTAFSDVKSAHWAAASIVWASQQHIVYGVGNGNYAPEDNISRQDMAVMILRFAQAEAITLPKSAAAIAFADRSSIPTYASAAVEAMQRAGIINGVVSGGKSYFKGSACASRAEAAKMISYLLAL
ncbi:MAG TPA: leucine-rich repeat protein [Clostridiales bacterium]|nr:leucine-rich repeat protein [Clostridiales bacterium]